MYINRGCPESLIIYSDNLFYFVYLGEILSFLSG